MNMVFWMLSFCLQKCNCWLSWTSTHLSRCSLVRKSSASTSLPSVPLFRLNSPFWYVSHHFPTSCTSLLSRTFTWDLTSLNFHTLKHFLLCSNSNYLFPHYPFIIFLISLPSSIFVTFASSLFAYLPARLSQSYYYEQHGRLAAGAFYYTRTMEKEEGSHGEEKDGWDGRSVCRRIRLNWISFSFIDSGY